MLQLQRLGTSVMTAVRGPSRKRKKASVKDACDDADDPTSADVTELQILAKPCVHSVLRARTQAVLPGTHIIVGNRLGQGTYGTVFCARLPLVTDKGEIVFHSNGTPMYETDWVALKIFEPDNKTDVPYSSDDEDAQGEQPLDRYVLNELYIGHKTRDCQHVVGLKMKKITVTGDSVHHVSDPLTLSAADIESAKSTPYVEEGSNAGWELGPFLMPNNKYQEACTTRIFIMPLWKLDLHTFQTRAIRCRLTTAAYYKTILRVLCQVACGMSEMHDLNIVHLDIKPSNVLLEYRNGKWHAALADLTIALRLPLITPTCVHSNHEDAKTASALQSPEMSQHLLRPSFPTDVFDWGLMAASFLSPSNSPLITCEIEAAAEAHCAGSKADILKTAYSKAQKREWQELWEDPSLFLVTPNPFVTTKEQLTACYVPEVWQLVSAALRCDPNKRILAKELANAEQWVKALHGAVSLPVTA